MKSYSFIIKYFKKYYQLYFWSLRTALIPGKSYIFWILFNSIFDGIDPILEIFFTARFLSEVAQILTTNLGEPVNSFIWLTALLLLRLFRQLFVNINNLIKKKYEHELLKLIENEIINKIYSLSQDQFDNEDFNTILSKANMGRDSINETFDSLLIVLSSLIRLLIALLAIAFASPLVTVIVILSLIPLIFFNSNINKKRDFIESDNDKDWRIMSRTGWVLSDPTRMPEIRLLGSFNKLLKIWVKHKNRIFKKEYEIEIDSSKKIVIGEMIFLIGEIFSNIWFLILAIQGKFGLDQFLFLRGLLQDTTFSGDTLVQRLQDIHKNTIQLFNLKKFLQTKSSIKDGYLTIKQNEAITIEFKNVWFRYPGKKEFALKNINLKIDPNKKIAFVGENGAGKTTITRLLLRQYLPTRGEILVNGKSLKNLKISSFYEKVSTLFQDFKLIEHLSISDNIKIASNQNLSSQEIKKFSKEAEAHIFIKKLKNGYDQRMLNTFNDGSELSGGELQRISLARTFARNSDILILDEPTSAIDSKTQFKIFKRLFSKESKKTIIIISHNFSAVREADFITVLDKGEIVEKGSHNELCLTGGIYKDMFEIQVKAYLD